jgi:pyrroline-5-carboxylate reductase
MEDSMIIHKTIAIVGAGNMGTALIGGMVQAGYEPARLIASDTEGERRSAVKQAWNVGIAEDNVQAVEEAEILLLAVKPGMVPQVLDEIKPNMRPDHTIISIAAGVRTASIEEQLGTDTPVVRVMPNTPALIGAGISALCPGTHASSEHLDMARCILETVGEVVLVTEKQMDAVTGLSGSGPAYVYTVIEALTDGGVRMGLLRDVALKLAAQTVLGSARMVLESGEHPAVLRDRVTSPGGTTIAGMQVLESSGFRGAIMSAVEVATRRSEELGKG